MAYDKKQLPRHWSPFVRVQITPDGANAIHKIQDAYHKFWGGMLKLCPVGTPERQHALKAMQESCMWLTKCAAVSNQSADNIAPWIKAQQEQVQASPDLEVDKDGWTVPVKGKGWTKEAVEQLAKKSETVITVKKNKLSE